MFSLFEPLPPARGDHSSDESSDSSSSVPSPTTSAEPEAIAALILLMGPECMIKSQIMAFIVKRYDLRRLSMTDIIRSAKKDKRHRLHEMIVNQLASGQKITEIQFGQLILTTIQGINSSKLFAMGDYPDKVSQISSFINTLLPLVKVPIVFSLLPASPQLLAGSMSRTTPPQFKSFKPPLATFNPRNPLKSIGVPVKLFEMGSDEDSDDSYHGAHHVDLSSGSAVVACWDEMKAMTEYYRSTGRIVDIDCNDVTEHVLIHVGDMLDTLRDQGEL